MKPNYTYNAIITKVYDGDTITADIDLGFNCWLKSQKIRLANINAPELHSNDNNAINAKNFLAYWTLHKTVQIKSIKYKKGKYGRYIAEIFVNGENINQKMLELNLAEETHY